ncbi:MAG TPA: thiamine pyrophosphate-dependent enzyme [Terriglobales bacterium]|nr:thiamine pyrophosphate-dependent enzyme [Terriglobales bacterium]
MATITQLQRVEEKDYSKYDLNKESLRRMYRSMLLLRRFEEKVEELFIVKGALIGPSHLYLGQEAIAVGAMSALQPDDQTVTTYRGHGHALAKGVPANLCMAELFGKQTGNCKGLGGSMHVAIYPKVGSLYATAIVGSGIPIAAGVGLALKQKKSKNIVATFFGDGACNTGAFHEGTNLIAVWKLPVLLFCENNQYAMSTPVKKAVSSPSIAERGRSYGMETIVVDGNDVLSVYVATKMAAERARRQGEPTFLECVTYKMKGHGVYDKGEYRPKEEVEKWLSRDPILLFEKRLIDSKTMSRDELNTVSNDVNREMEEAVKFAMQGPVLPFETITDYVYARE